MDIRTARRSKKMTQEDLAAAIGVTSAMISRYESGIASPPIEKLRRIAEALDVSVADLLETNESERQEPDSTSEFEGMVLGVLRNQLASVDFPATEPNSQSRLYFDCKCMMDEKTWLFDIVRFENEDAIKKAFQNTFIFSVGKASLLPNISKLSFVTTFPCDRIAEQLSVSLRDSSVGFDVSILHVDLESGRIDYELELLTHYDGKGFFDLTVPGKEAESARKLAKWKSSLSATR